MKRYPYYIPPRSSLPKAAGWCGGLLALNTAYTLFTMPNYTGYWDYWATLVAGVLLAVTCLLGIRRKTELILIPTGLLVLIGCFDPRFVHWIELGMFFLLLLLLLFKLPAFCANILRFIGTILLFLGSISVLAPVCQRIYNLSQSGKATTNFVIPYLLRTLGGDVLCMLALLLLIFSLKPYWMPGWMEEDDNYDRIWE